MNMVPTSAPITPPISAPIIPHFDAPPAFAPAAPARNSTASAPSAMITATPIADHANHPPCDPNHQASTTSLATASTIMNQIPGNPKMIDIPNIPASSAKNVALE